MYLKIRSQELNWDNRKKDFAKKNWFAPFNQSTDQSTAQSTKHDFVQKNGWKISVALKAHLVSCFAPVDIPRRPDRPPRSNTCEWPRETPDPTRVWGPSRCTTVAMKGQVARKSCAYRHWTARWWLLRRLWLEYFPLSSRMQRYC